MSSNYKLIFLLIRFFVFFELVQVVLFGLQEPVDLLISLLDLHFERL